MSITDQQNKVEAEIKKLEEMGGRVPDRLRKYRDGAFAKFPLLFTLFSTFGLVATLYGFEKVIDRIDYFAENPYMILLTGVVILVTTGALYKKLS